MPCMSDDYNAISRGPGTKTASGHVDEPITNQSQTVRQPLISYLRSVNIAFCLSVLFGRLSKGVPTMSSGVRGTLVCWALHPALAHPGGPLCPSNNPAHGMSGFWIRQVNPKPKHIEGGSRQCRSWLTCLFRQRHKNGCPQFAPPRNQPSILPSKELKNVLFLSAETHTTEIQLKAQKCTRI